PCDPAPAPCDRASSRPAAAAAPASARAARSASRACASNAEGEPGAGSKPSAGNVRIPIASLLVRIEPAARLRSRGHDPTDELEPVDKAYRDVRKASTAAATRRAR